MTQPLSQQSFSSQYREANKDWLRALQRTAVLDGEEELTLSALFDQVAKQRPSEPALISDAETYDFSGLAERARQYARFAMSRGLRKGDVVGLVMENRAEYVAIWFGLTQIGVIVALFNTNLKGAALAHCVTSSGARLVVASLRFQTICREAIAQTTTALAIYGGGDGDETLMVDEFSKAPLDVATQDRATLSDTALYIYTSGTTGLPKPALVSHRRLSNWALWFGGLTGATSADRMYDCLPLYHSTGGVVAIWSALLSGGSVVIREKFSASGFWREIAEFDCTMFQYIGELCRYIAHAPAPQPLPRNRLRLCVGNGLRADVWRLFEARFPALRILEFYAATESNFSLYNVDGEPGAVGRVPGFLAHKHHVAIVKIDHEVGRPLRGANGLCVPCAVNESGEAIGRIRGAAKETTSAFEGYVDRADTERKILRNVFAPGDAWMRSGDLMKRDARGYFYFVDRLGDTFRWKGENVSTQEVERTLCGFPGVVDAVVFGVAVAGHEGRAGMAAIVTTKEFDLTLLRSFLDESLPHFARPVFLRLTSGFQTTATFKTQKQTLAADGFNPNNTSDALFYSAADDDAYHPFDHDAFAKILRGLVRL